MSDFENSPEQGAPLETDATTTEVQSFSGEAQALFEKSEAERIARGFDIETWYSE